MTREPHVSEPFVAPPRPDTDAHDVPDIDVARDDRRAKGNLTRYVIGGIGLLIVLGGAAYLASVTSIKAPKAMTAAATPVGEDSLTDRIAHIEAWSRDNVAPRSQEMVNSINYLHGEVTKLKAEVAAFKSGKPIAAQANDSYKILNIVFDIAGTLVCLGIIVAIVRLIRRARRQK